VMYQPRLIRRAMRQRFIVTLPGGEGVFSGILVDYDREFWRFENCHSIPTKIGETVDDWPGRFWVKHTTSPAPLLCEVTPDARQQFLHAGREP
jgi:hypothetical protein